MYSENEIFEIMIGAKEAFFRAMLEGYFGDGVDVRKEKSPNGYKTMVWEEREFRVIDSYCTTPGSNYSAGTTTIFFQGRPIWWMSYGGQYDGVDAIIFLKKVLAETYRNREFHAGRGPVHFQEDGLVYMNHWEQDGSDFSHFEGQEEIFESSKKTFLGFHKYFGMSLI